MRRFFRFTLLGFTWLFLVAIVVQVYFAGLMLFGQEEGRELHENIGWLLGLVGALFLVLPALARAGVTTIVLGVVLALVTYFQPFLTFARETSALIAALHPVNAILIVALSLVLIRRASDLVRHERAVAVAATR